MSEKQDNAASEDAVDNQDTDTSTTDETTVEVAASTDETDTNKGDTVSTESDDKDAADDESVALKAEDYKLPEGVPSDIAKLAEELGFTQEQLDGSLAKYDEIAKATQLAEYEAIRKEGESLVREWGDNAKANLTLVRRALQVNDPTGELADALNATGFGNHPAVLRYLLNVGKSLNEGDFVSGDTNTPQPKKTAAQVLFGKTHKSIAN